MTIEELGQATKKKYPQYASIPDAQLGQSILKDYPQYQSLVTVKQPSKFVQGVKEDFTTRGKKVMQSQERTYSGKQSIPELGLQTLGQGLGLVGDIGARAAGAAYRAITPKRTEESVKEYGMKILDSHAGQTALYAALQGMEAYQGWKQENPRLAANLEATVNIASIIPAVKGTQAAYQTGKDTLKAGGKVVTGAGKGLKETVKELPGMVKGGRIMESISERISPLPESVKKVLQATGNTTEELATSVDEKMSKLNLYITQGMEAAADNSIKTPLEIAGEQAEGALTKMQGILKTVGKAKESAMAGVANQTTNINQVRRSLAQKLKERAGLVVTKDGMRSAPGRIAKVTESSDLSALQTTLSLLTRLGEQPTLRKIDDAVDAIQDILYKRKAQGAVPINTNVQSILKSTVKDLNDQLRTMGGQAYREANDTYATVVDLRNKLNKSLGLDASKGGALMKRIFSPSDAGTKEMFANIKAVTGIDLIEEATYAKFVMDSIGDPRSASLLKQLGLLTDVATGKVGRLVERGIQTLDDPLEQAKRFITKPLRESQKKINKTTGSALAAGVIANEELEKEGIDLKSAIIIGSLLVGASFLRKGKAAPSVLQIINPATGGKEFKLIKAKDLPLIKELVDSGGVGYSGKEIKGKIYHLTAKTPESMKNNGFKSRGYTSIGEIRRLARIAGGS